MEVTRTIQIEVTDIMHLHDGEKVDIKSTDWIADDLKEMFRGSDQVNVTVKDFVRDDV